MSKINKKIVCKVCGTQTQLWFDKVFDDRHGYPGLFDIYKCPHCQFAQTEPELPPQKIAQVYTKYYPRQHFDVSTVREGDYRITNRRKLWQKGLNSCQYWVKPNTSVLDVGCGLGHSLLELKSIGCDAYGIDPDEHAQLMADKFDLKFHKGFIEDKPFGKKKFDYVIGSQVLEHTNDPLGFLKSLKSRVKPGGQIILSFPNTDSMYRKICGRKWLHWHIPYHINFFSRESLEILAREAGLEIVKVQTITPNPWTNWQFRHVFRNPVITKRDTFWDSGRPDLDTKISGWRYWFYEIVKRTLFIWEEWNLFNRLVDLLGWGDSFVITLR